MSTCANCQQPAPDGERLCGPCFNADFIALTGRLKSSERVYPMRESDRLKVMDRMGAMKMPMPKDCFLRDINAN